MAETRRVSQNNNWLNSQLSHAASQHWSHMGTRQPNYNSDVRTLLGADLLVLPVAPISPAFLKKIWIFIGQIRILDEQETVL